MSTRNFGGGNRMHRFKKILLVYGPDSKTLEQAVRLAKKNHAHLTVVDVIQPVPPGIDHLVNRISSISLKDLLLKEYRTRLEEFAAPLRENGLQVSTSVLVGTPFLEIIREVIRNRHDLVIMNAEKGKGGRTRLFGSTPMHLMRKCPCPVWVMRSTRRKQYARILAAVDPDPSDKRQGSLDAAIVEIASSLAALEQAELHIVHAWSLFSETFLVVRGHLPHDEVNRLLKQEEAAHKRKVDALVSRHAAGNARVHVSKGEADDVITRFVKAERIDLLVIGTVSRTGVSGFLIGNTAERVLNEVDCSVLTVKPKGFVSPVTLGE